MSPERPRNLAASVRQRLLNLARERSEDFPASLHPVVKAREMIDLGVVYKARAVVETIEQLLRPFGRTPRNSRPA